MLKKSLEALFNAHPQAETISHLITLIWTIYQKLIVHPQYQQSLETLFLSAVPKLSSIALNDLNKSLQRESNEKKKRTLFKKMLSPIIGASKQHLTARPLINNISHEFHIPKTKPTMSDQDGIIDLGSLFSNNSGDNNSWSQGEIKASNIFPPDQDQFISSTLTVVTEKVRLELLCQSPKCIMRQRVDCSSGWDGAIVSPSFSTFSNNSSIFPSLQLFLLS